MNPNLPRIYFGQIAFVALMLLGVVAIDFSTGSEIRVYPLYFLPIAYAANKLGRTGAFLTAIAGALLWLISNSLTGQENWSFWVWVWNTGIQAVAFLLIAFLISRLRESLQNEHSLARVDSLTGLLNIRAFREHAPELIALCHRQHNPVVMAYIDLDNFKQVNDSQGHQRGDEVLCIIAQILRDNLRATDLLARFGGDEFAALLPNASADTAMETLERLRAAIELEMHAQGCNVTASIGAVAYPAAPGKLDTVVNAADGVMYSVKLSGKNNVRILSESLA